MSAPIRPGAAEPWDSPEARYLLGALRNVFRAGSHGRAPSVPCDKPTGALDERDLVHRAGRHSVVPLVLKGLEPWSSTLPAGMLGDLFWLQQRSARRCRRLTHALHGILKLLQARGIEPFPFKGPALAVFLHGDPTRRQFGDLDVVVRPRQFPAAVRALVDAGWHLEGDGTMDPSGHALELHRNDIKLELHWAFASQHGAFALDLDELWPRLLSLELEGVVVPAPAPEDLLLLLCVHGAKDRWRSLQWVCDVAALLVRYELDEGLVLDRARALGVERRVLLGVALAGKLLGTGPAEAFEAPLKQDPYVAELTESLWQRLGAPEADWHDLDVWVYYMRLRERRLDRWRYGAHLVLRRARPTEQDRRDLPLPSLLSPLHYPLRWIRLVKRHGLAPLARLAGPRVKGRRAARET